MTNAIASHTYPALNASIRVITIDGTPWFPAKDVCDALGINNPSSAAINSCPEHQRQHVLKSNLANCEVSFPNRGMLCINEGGLYKLLFVSRKAEALAFQDWVTEHVLPAIRKDGGYIMGEEKVVSGEMSEDELVLKAMEVMQTKIMRLTTERDEAKQVQAIAASQIANKSRTLHKIARTLEGVNTMAIKRDLWIEGYLYRKAGQYRVYAKFQHLFQEKIDEQYGKAEIICTEAGVMEVQELHRKGALTMKASHRS